MAGDFIRRKALIFEIVRLTCAFGFGLMLAIASTATLTHIGKIVCAAAKCVGHGEHAEGFD